MDIYKFEPSDVDVSKGIEDMVDIMTHLKGQPSIVVVSALGSTNHTLEAISEAYFAGRREDALQTFQSLFGWHVGLLRASADHDVDEAVAHLDEFRTEVEWLLYDKPVRPFDYYYDQIICAGVLMSSVIIASSLKQAGLNVRWTDVRDIIRTDDQFRHAEIDMSFTQQQVDRIIRPAMVSTDILVTQGFIGSTDENESTTLGDEGADKTASVFALCMDAKIKSI